MLTSAALALLMTLGLSFFYGGMVRAKGVLNMVMMSIVSMGIVGVVWVLFGFSMVFGDSIGGFVGNPFDFAGLTSYWVENAVVGTVPALVFVGFQAAFAIIAVALVSGAVARPHAVLRLGGVRRNLGRAHVYFPADLGLGVRGRRPRVRVRRFHRQ